jgi:ketosteroid isomerase-like protein
MSPESGNETPSAIVDAFGRAWSGHDLDGAIGFLTEDCVFDATGPAPDGTCHVGPDEIRTAWKAIFEDPSSRFEIEETFSAGDRVVQRWRYSWLGSHVRGVDLFKLRGDKIAEKLAYVKG